MPLEVDVSTGDAARRLRGLATELLDLRPFWRIGSLIAKGWIADQFSSQGSFSGDPWAPLSPDYASAKAEARPGRSLLVYDGFLRSHVDGRRGPRAEATADTLTLHIDDPKAVFHQEGTSKMPARPLIPTNIPALEQRQLREAAEEYVASVVRKWGFS